MDTKNGNAKKFESVNATYESWLYGVYQKSVRLTVPCKVCGNWVPVGRGEIIPYVGMRCDDCYVPDEPGMTGKSRMDMPGRSDRQYEGSYVE